MRICTQECPFNRGVIKDPWDQVNFEPFKNRGMSWLEFKNMWEENKGVMANCALLFPNISFLGLKCAVKDEVFTEGVCLARIN